MIAGGVTLSVIVSPVVAAVTVGKRSLFFSFHCYTSCLDIRNISRASSKVQLGEMIFSCFFPLNLCFISYRKEMFIASVSCVSQVSAFPSCSRTSTASSRSLCVGAEAVAFPLVTGKGSESSSMTKMTTSALGQ